MLVCGCVTTYSDSKIRQAVGNGEIKLGMTVGQVMTVVSKQQNTLIGSWKRETKEDGEYITWIPFGTGMYQKGTSSYRFIFKDERLLSWSEQNID
jgi:hypothetical protein